MVRSWSLECPFGEYIMVKQEISKPVLSPLPPNQSLMRFKIKNLDDKSLIKILDDITILLGIRNMKD